MVLGTGGLRLVGAHLRASPRVALAVAAYLIICISLLPFTYASPIHADSTTHYVNAGESIQDAINAASPGDTIVVNAGTYVENLTIGKELTLQSADGPEDTTIESTSSAGTTVAISSASGVTIDGFTVTSGTYGVTVTTCNSVTLTNLTILGGSNGIRLNHLLSDIAIRDCTITDTTSGGIYKDNAHGLTGFEVDRVTINASSGAGILLGDTNANAAYVVRDVVLTDVTIDGGWRGVFIYNFNVNSRNVDIVNCMVSNTSDHGIYLVSARGAVSITDTTVSGVGSGYYGIRLEGAATDAVTLAFSGNTLEDNGNGLYVQSVSGGEVSSNTIRNNTGYGIYLSSCNGNLVYNNFIASNGTNARDDASAPNVNDWNVEPEEGPNIVGGPHFGGNYWSDYAGEDTDDDGLGDTMLPYNCGGQILNGGDNHPLVPPTLGGQVELSLVQGWNLISAPLLIGDNTVDEVFTNADCEIEIVYTWDAAQQCYEEVHDGNPSFNTIEPHRAYWVKVNSTPGDEPVTVTISGEPADDADWLYGLSEGWNMVGIPYSADPVPFNDFWAGGSGDTLIQQIYYWNADVRHYERVTESDDMIPGVGYWMALVPGLS